MADSAVGGRVKEAHRRTAAQSSSSSMASSAGGDAPDVVSDAAAGGGHDGKPVDVLTAIEKISREDLMSLVVKQKQKYVGCLGAEVDGWMSLS